MVRGPADVEDVSLDDGTVLAKPGQGLNSSDCADEDLRKEKYLIRGRPLMTSRNFG